LRKLAIGGLVAVFGIAVVLGLWLTSQFTECHGSFKTSEAAERAADAARDAGLDASVDPHPAEPGIRAEWAVTFETGETGSDAEADRGTFRQILDRERGEPAHPDGGCDERGAFE
jgi:hypothetical protein